MTTEEKINRNKERAYLAVEKFIKAFEKKNYRRIIKTCTFTNQHQLSKGHVRNVLKDIAIPEYHIVLFTTKSVNQHVYDVETSKGVVRCICEKANRKPDIDGHMGVNFQSAMKLFKK